jgi:hypothetical protein
MISRFGEMECSTAFFRVHFVRLGEAVRAAECRLCASMPSEWPVDLWTFPDCAYPLSNLCCNSFLSGCVSRVDVQLRTCHGSHASGSGSIGRLAHIYA